MTLVRKNGVIPTIPQFFDDFLTRDLLNWGFNHRTPVSMTLPSVNVVENNENFLVEMAAPGMNKEDFQIELDNGLLSISSQKESQHEQQEGTRYTRQEFSYQSFKRSFQLPKGLINDAKIEAKYQDGILHILIPKKEEAKTQAPRKIAIG